jgi:hypothetical protein
MRKLQGFTSFSRTFLSLGSRKRAPQEKRRSGPKSLLSQFEIVLGMVFHVISGAGTMGEHIELLTGLKFSESTLSGRRMSTDWKVFETLLGDFLRVRCKEKEQPDAFYKGLRLVALDGTQFSLSNTPQILKSCAKTLSRRMKAAFAKIGTVTLIEIGAHNPIAAQIATSAQESEWELAQILIEKLPAKSLLLADRLYGVAAFLNKLLKICESQKSHFLVRARNQLKSQILKRFADGSSLIEVAVQNPKKQRSILKTIKLREIRVVVTRPGFRSEEVRLWTSILDYQSYPALELAKVYTKRWEHELYYRQLKIDLGRTELLQSHTVHTAAQEIAALIFATALIAQERLTISGGKIDTLKISFAKTLNLLQPVWMLFSVASDILELQQKESIKKRLYKMLAHHCIKKKRARSCPRQVRQPIKGWPRLTKNTQTLGEVTYEIIKNPACNTERHWG